MPIGIGAALLIAGAAQAAGGIAGGIGQARAGKKMMLSAAERKELDALERRGSAGQLGLDEGERGALEQQFLAEQAGAQRELEAAALQQAAARGMGGPISGREVFLAEQAEAGAERAMRQDQNRAVQDIDRAEAEAEQARIDAMRAQQKAAEAQRTQGIFTAVSLGLAAGGETAGQASAQMNQMEVARIEADAKAGTAEDAFRQLDTGTDTFATMGSI
tara:strand:+ start:2643 stop:3296 length:654 start_codon:yes stop_codon:yes gene_type:complete